MGGPIDFNEASGKKLDRFTFEGKSQGWSAGAGPFSSAWVKSFSNGEWSMPGNINKSPLLYSGDLAGVGPGAPLGVQYSFTVSKLIDNWSIPFKK